MNVTTTILKTGKSRAERKVKRDTMLAEAEAKRIAFAKDHPVSAGVIPMVDYVAPSGSYQPAARRDVLAIQAKFARETLQRINLVTT